MSLDILHYQSKKTWDTFPVGTEAVAILGMYFKIGNESRFVFFCAFVFVCFCFSSLFFDFLSHFFFLHFFSWEFYFSQKNRYLDPLFQAMSKFQFGKNLPKKPQQATIEWPGLADVFKTLETEQVYKKEKWMVSKEKTERENNRKKSPHLKFSFLFSFPKLIFFFFCRPTVTLISMGHSQDHHVVRLLNGMSLILNGKSLKNNLTF